MSFAGGLKCLLREEGEMMMVGEIGDLESGDIGMKGGETGDMVF
ncbi:ATPase, T2SS/T4P/T4SS family [Neisseria sicca]